MDAQNRVGRCRRCSKQLRFIDFLYQRPVQTETLNTSVTVNTDGTVSAHSWKGMALSFHLFRRPCDSCRERDPLARARDTRLNTVLLWLGQQFARGWVTLGWLVVTYLTLGPARAKEHVTLIVVWLIMLQLVCSALYTRWKSYSRYVPVVNSQHRLAADDYPAGQLFHWYRFLVQYLAVLGLVLVPLGTAGVVYLENYHSPTSSSASSSGPGAAAPSFTKHKRAKHAPAQASS